MDEQRIFQMLEQLNAKMDKLIQLLENQHQNQSSYEASMCPCVVQLPIKDLVDLYAVRAQQMTRQAKP